MDSFDIFGLSLFVVITLCIGGLVGYYLGEDEVADIVCQDIGFIDGDLKYPENGEPYIECSGPISKVSKVSKVSNVVRYKANG